jgi:hypothetical protein
MFEVSYQKHQWFLQDETTQSNVDILKKVVNLELIK